MKKEEGSINQQALLYCRSDQADGGRSALHYRRAFTEPPMLETLQARRGSTVCFTTIARTVILAGRLQLDRDGPSANKQ